MSLMISKLINLKRFGYYIQKKGQRKTRMTRVREVVNERDVTFQAPKQHEIPPLQEPTIPTGQAPTRKQTVGTSDVPCCLGSNYGIHPPPIQATSYRIPMGLVRRIEEFKFFGAKTENPYEHVFAFERMCDLFRAEKVPDDSLRLLLFPFSLGGKASDWESTLPSHLVTSWKDCKRLFLSKFYPLQRTVQARQNILEFKQGLAERFHEAWARLKSYTRDCPHHGFGDGELLAIFYRGVLKEHRLNLDAASKGSFYKLEVDQAKLLVENFAVSFENYEEWDENPLEEPSQGANMENFNKESVKREELVYVQALEAHSVQQGFPNEANLEFTEWNQVQEPMQEYGIQDNHHDLELNSMFQQLLTEQAYFIAKLSRMEEEINALYTRDMSLDNEDTQSYSLPTAPTTKAMMDDNEKSIQELERILYGSQKEELICGNEEKIEDMVGMAYPEAEYLGNFSTTHVVSPPKALGYGNDESTMALDGSSLDALFSPPIDDQPLTRKERSYGNHHRIIKPSSSKMILVPMKHVNGTIEYKVKCNGRAKPFAKVRAILPNELKEKGLDGIQEALSRVLQPEFKDPPWSSNAPFSHT